MGKTEDEKLMERAAARRSPALPDPPGRMDPHLTPPEPTAVKVLNLEHFHGRFWHQRSRAPLGER